MYKTVIKNCPHNVWVNAKKLALGRLSLPCASLVILTSINIKKKVLLNRNITVSVLVLEKND